MILPHLLPVLQIIITLFAPGIVSYPTSMYGSKRYGRSSAHRVSSAYDPYDSMLRTQRYPINYYKLYPDSQDEYYYYPQDSYPVYYPPARTSKYEVYQAVLPYYYQETPPPVSRSTYSNYYGYGMDPTVDLQGEMIQEAEREQRERSQPIGHEIMYENADGSSNEADSVLDEANAEFLQNLMLQQAYQDSLKQQNNDQASASGYYDQPYYDDYENLGKWEDLPYDKPSLKEDEDVRELKELVKQKQARKQKLRNREKNDNEEVHWFQKSNSYKKDNKRNTAMKDQPEGVMVYTERKPVVKDTKTTVKETTTTEAPKRVEVRGQKEEVLMRPATPVRHPFSNSVLEMISKNNVERKRSPSVYDTIKHMLEVEKSLEKNKNESELRPSMKKRIISTDESLTRQLSVLKKSQ